jgi:hypothetical protein
LFVVFFGGFLILANLEMSFCHFFGVFSTLVPSRSFGAMLNFFVEKNVTRKNLADAKSPR